MLGGGEARSARSSGASRWPLRSSLRKRAKARSAAGAPARTPRKFGSWPPRPSAPRRTASESSGAVSSSWIWNRLIWVFFFMGAGPSRRGVIAHTIVGTNPSPACAATSASLDQADCGLGAGAADRGDEDEEEAEQDGPEGDPVRARADALARRARAAVALRAGRRDGRDAGDAVDLAADLDRAALGLGAASRSASSWRRRSSAVSSQLSLAGLAARGAAGSVVRRAGGRSDRRSAPALGRALPVLAGGDVRLRPPGACRPCRHVGCRFLFPSAYGVS